MNDEKNPKKTKMSNKQKSRFLNKVKQNEENHSVVIGKGINKHAEFLDQLKAKEIVHIFTDEENEKYKELAKKVALTQQGIAQKIVKGVNDLYFDKKRKV